MLNIALCGNREPAAGNTAGIIADCARVLDIPQPSILEFASAFELLEHVDDRMAEPLIDLAIIDAHQAGMSGMQIVRDARKSGFDGEFILLEDTGASALEAQRLDVRGYLAKPVNAEDLADEIYGMLERLAKIDADSVTLRMRGGLRRIVFTRFVYAQTSNHDQVLHLRDGQTAQLRCSSQELFDQLSHDPRFLKLGSSYIVNLDLVQSLYANGAALTFVDGSEASVPVRFRKAMQDALLDRAEWRKHA
ncbi:MAG: LytTR family transcriptional regulator DNA-binding domain-containing protein [Coriobacteriaceae bacterium]|nr:LytTR family transcriptional regulator DNA-binding domain-containing protein [Coriobacteriaceae bacterium]